MEIVAPLTFIATVMQDRCPALSREGTILACLYLIHYLHRAVISPLILSPSRSPLHAFVMLCAQVLNLLNTYCLANGLAFYPPPSRSIWLFVLGWAIGFLGNVYHDEILNDLRRPVARTLVSKPSREEEGDRKKGGGRYAIPRGGLFTLVSFPNYLCEWRVTDALQSCPQRSQRRRCSNGPALLLLHRQTPSCPSHSLARFICLLPSLPPSTSEGYGPPICSLPHGSSSSFFCLRCFLGH